MNFRELLGQKLATVLWGRRTLGKLPDETDKDWLNWKSNEANIYHSNQRTGVGLFINKSAYDIVNSVDLTGKRILEIGAGDVLHFNHWNNLPKEYFVVDVSEAMLKFSNLSLEKTGIKFRNFKIAKNDKLPIDSKSIDVIISFFSLEHIYPLENHIKELYRVLKPGGFIVGGIPAEGGLAWGLGRLLTSRRKVKKSGLFDYDKIIAWEHPNFADEIIEALNTRFLQQKIVFWPFPIQNFDINLIVKFIYEKK